MKLRWKILLVILLAGLWFTLVQHSKTPAMASRKPTQLELSMAYQEFNEVYFKNRLPADVLIDFSETTDMASTIRMSNGQFYLAFNEIYNNSTRQARETMLHEQCHVKTWRTLEEMTSEEILTNQHGRRWRACMLQLDMQGAFRREIIDFYEGN